MIGRFGTMIALVAVATTLACCAAPPPAAAFNPVKPICSLTGLVSTLAGKICSAAGSPGRLVDAGKKLLGGHLGGAVKGILGDGGGGAATGVVKAVTFTAGLAAVGAWVVGGARFALHETAAVMAATTRPDLQSTWFSAFYWRMAGVAALLTLPFLFAAAIQAMVRSDLTLLLRSAFGYLPLGLLAVSIAAPLTMLLLAASDQISQLVSSAAGNAEGDFLAKASLGAGALSLASHSPFLAFFVGLLAAAAALVLWCELLIRSAAVYVIVLMLPLFFAALVWPARRVWAVRAVELLVALILSKFAIVAVLALGGAAIGHTTFPSLTDMLAGATLILLAAFSPWALLRLLPLHEMAAGVAAGLRTHPVDQLALAANQAADVGRDRPDSLLLSAGPDPEPAARTAVQRLEGDGERSREDGAAEGPAQAGPAAGAGPGAAPSPGEFPVAGELAVAPPAGGAPSVVGEPGSDVDAVADPAGGPGRDSAPGPPADVQHDPAADPGPPVEDRVPGMPALWQAEDGAWRTLRLGPDADYRQLNETGPAPQAGDDDEPTGEGDRPGEDHDPRPPAQDPDGGPL